MGPITFRSIREDEQAQALALWYDVFGAPAGFFERYYQPQADPEYRAGDTLGAWDGETLVSAVHLCRRLVVWNGGTLLCGAIANVATHPDFRNRGLSRKLLEMAIEKMERERFDFSLLGTGVPGHYAALGWELTHAPRMTLSLHSGLSLTGGVWQRFDALPPLYAANPRPLQFLRSPAYGEGWVGWNLRQLSPLMCHSPGHGYLILVVPESETDTIFATEWRAADAEAEQTLLQAAAAEVLRHGRDRLGLEAVPQFAAVDFLKTLGTVTMETDTGSMVRNLSLPEGEYAHVLQAYRSGKAVWWSADGF